TIRKIGHCCLLIEIDGVRILTDPGELSMAQNDAENIDAILITHEHYDHLHIESVKKILENNPETKIITNTSVGKILDKESIPYQIVEDTQHIALKDVLIEAFGDVHAEIWKELGRVQNTGYFIAQKLFYPGDALYIPAKTPEILALPIAGSWIKIKEAIEYAIVVKPKTCFPVHDGVVEPKALKRLHEFIKKVFEAEEIKFTPMLAGDEHDFF
ncbi:MAG: MBL fold metallo-hydrolase, partial [bacterium]|nr:MBL fold metallo-hydrolase [bacterium]